MTKILGISAFYHDSAAALIEDGNIIAAVQEERFSRRKHDDRFPINAIKFLLKNSNCNLNEIDKIVFYEKPFLKFERLLETNIAYSPRGFKQFLRSIPIWVKDKLFQKKNIIKYLKDIDINFQPKDKILFSEHHFSHAASAFYPSPFNEAIILTADGVGEWATTTVAIGKNNKVMLKKEIEFPHSLGLLYSAFTYYAGFKVNGGEYKLMGLAPYGEPKFAQIILDNLIDIKEDGSFRLNQKYFDYATGLTMTNNNFNKLFGNLPRNPDEEEVGQFHMDIAASIQNVTEQVMMKIVKYLHKEYKIDNLCLAGGVALNCVANGKILNEKIFKNIWIQPAAGDAGGSLGAALGYWYGNLEKERINNNKDLMKCSYLGPKYSDQKINDILENIGANFKTLTKDELLNYTSDKLIEGKAIGWFQGKMEFGPRALGGRSIIGDARSSEMQRKLNLKVKFRESFRPFAPSILLDDLNDWFDLNSESPYMLLVGKVKGNKLIEQSPEQKKAKGLDKLNIVRSLIPAVTHVDNTARIQTVTSENGIYYELLKKFKDKTGCPVIVNTSFNVRGEPPVNTPIDAYKCFMATDLDILIVGNCVLEKNNQLSVYNMDKIFNKKYTVDDNLVKLGIDDATVEKVVKFYNEAPFPNYEEQDDKSSINSKGDKNYLAREFKKFIGFNKDILEVGCGTGQLSLYFSIGNNNRIFALDPTLASINLGRDFSKKNKIENTKFVNADIFDDVFKDEVFDFIWTNGVLHHTKNPSLAFDITSRYLKKNGYILVGLYNRYGRVKTLIRKKLYQIFGKSIVMLLDPTLRNLKRGNDQQIKSWIRDQYEHPVESLHTLDEVLSWFKKNNIEFINSIPRCYFDEKENKNMFDKSTKGSFISRLFSQFSMLFNNLGDDGGLFVVIGKKRDHS